MSNTIELEEKYDLGTYPKRDLVLVRGKNAIVWDDSGNEYIDCATGVGVAAVGHCMIRLLRQLMNNLVS